MEQTFAAEDFLIRLCKAWRGKLELAKQAKKPWDDVREQCMTFVSGGPAEFWKTAFQEKFLGTSKVQTTFKISLNKAFELIAIFGPVLYARNPIRDVYPYDPVEFEIEALGDPNDPQVQQRFQQMQAMQTMESARNRARCALLEQYLNYTPQEQPQGLQEHAEDAITDALIGGLGLLWPQVYTMPGSERTLTGCFYDSSDNLQIDPDPRSMDFGKAKWVARWHMDPIWEVERRWKLPPGSLKNYVHMETASAQSERRAGRVANLEKSRGTTNDLMGWWELWSCNGIGTRLAGVDEQLNTGFDEYVGDYAYIAVAEGDLPYPLNCPLNALRTESVEQIQRRFRWPIPFWQDQRWPFAALRFYKHPHNAFPIAPLAPGLGELTFLNFLVNRTATHIWQSSKQFVGVVESARAEVEKILKRGDDLAIFGIKDMHRNVKQVVDFLQYPNISQDVWTIAAAVMEMFDKRVGLSELLYSMNVGGVASRTATDVQAKQEHASVRPDYMAHRVESWMSDVAAMEKLVAFWGGVSGRDIAPLLGSSGAMLWDEIFASADPESIAREMVCQVASGSAKKRNRATELGSLREFFGPLSQQFTAYATATTDTGAANELNAKLFDALDFDGEGLEMGPWAPPPLPEGQSPEEQEEEFKEDEHESEQERQEEQHEQEMQHSEEKHEQEIVQKAEMGELDLRLKQSQAKAQAQAARTKPKAKAK